MSRSRRQQPLFEVLSETQRRGGLVAPGGRPADGVAAPASPPPPSPVASSTTRTPVAPPPLLDKPVVVHPTYSASPRPAPPTADGPDRSGRANQSDRDAAAHRPGLSLTQISGPTIMLAIAGVMILGFGIWTLGYRQGEKQTRNTLSPFVDETGTSTPAPTDEIPAPSGPSSVRTQKPDTATKGPGPAARPDRPSGAPPAAVPTSAKNQTPPTASPAADKPKQAPAPVVAGDPRKPGNNYLEICILTWKDAEAAVAYLAKNGVQAAASPVKAGVDPASARDKNLPHLVFVTEGGGVPSDRFKATAKQRDDLIAKVQRIGGKWQREERGPSDFAQPGWRLYKGQ